MYFNTQIMKVLVIDDHKINRLYLKNLLEENFPVINRIDEAATVAASIDLVETMDYDIIFLDMELGDGVGFEVLKKIKDFVYVIIVSCYKEYAIQAFKHNVVDYILKPVNVAEFKTAVKKVIGLYDKSTMAKKALVNSENSAARKETEGGLMVNYKNEFIAINRKDIVFIKALGKYSEIHVSGSRHYTSYKNLKEFENAMTDILIRIHHSYLVNIGSIVSFSRETSHVRLNNGQEIPVSVRKREELFKKFQVF